MPALPREAFDSLLITSAAPCPLKPDFTAPASPNGEYSTARAATFTGVLTNGIIRSMTNGKFSFADMNTRVTALSSLYVARIASSNAALIASCGTSDADLMPLA